jgi:hypothetical protein
MYRRDVDDAPRPLLQHVPPGRPAAVEGATEIDVEHLRPFGIGDAFGPFEQRADAGVVDENIKAPVPADDGLGALIHAARIRDRPREHSDPVTVLAQFRG